MLKTLLQQHGTNKNKRVVFDEMLKILLQQQHAFVENLGQNVPMR